MRSDLVGGGPATRSPGPTFTVNTNTDGSPTPSGLHDVRVHAARGDHCGERGRRARTRSSSTIAGDTQINLTSALPVDHGAVVIDGQSQSDGEIVGER